MANAGRKGGLDTARELISMVCSLKAEGDEIKVQTIQSRFGKTSEDARADMEIIQSMSLGDGRYLPFRTDDNDRDSIWLSEGVVLKDRTLRLTPEETAAVQCALSWMKTPEDDPLARQVSEAMGARDYDPESVGRMVAPLESSAADDVRRTCARAMLEHYDLRFLYRKIGETTEEERHVRPLRFEQRDGVHTLRALDLDRDAQRTFCLDGISDARLFGEPRRKDEDEGDEAAVAGQEARQVTLWFDDEHWLELLPWLDLEARRSKSGGLLAKTPWYGGTWLPRMIAACGGHVTCDDPEVTVAVHKIAAAELGK